MSRRKIAISSAGGIAPGAPFKLGGALFVEQASPPVAYTSRLGALTDANQSLIAPGAFAGGHSFVMGASVLDTAGGTDTVMIGYNIQQCTAGASGQVLLGSAIIMPLDAVNSNNIVAIGASITFTESGSNKSFGSSVVIGTGIVVQPSSGGGDASNMVVIGSGTLNFGTYNIVVGYQARAYTDQCIAIGYQATAGTSTQGQCVAIGFQANAGGSRSHCIGQHAIGGNDSISIGFFATTLSADSSLAIGRDTVASGVGSMAIGRGASNAFDYVALFGSNSYPINSFRFGNGYNENVGGHSYIFACTDLYNGSGANLNGNTLTIRAGCGTGNWANAGNLGLDLQVGTVGSSGTNSQAYASAVAMRHSDLNIALWGGLAATFGGGAHVLFIGAATTASTTAPTGGGLLYVKGGSNDLFYRNSANVETQLN